MKSFFVFLDPPLISVVLRSSLKVEWRLLYQPKRMRLVQNFHKCLKTMPDDMKVNQASTQIGLG